MQEPTKAHPSQHPAVDQGVLAASEAHHGQVEHSLALIPAYASSIHQGDQTFLRVRLSLAVHAAAAACAERVDCAAVDAVAVVVAAAADAAIALGLETSEPVELPVDFQDESIDYDQDDCSSMSALVDS